MESDNDSEHDKNNHFRLFNSVFSDNKTIETKSQAGIGCLILDLIRVTGVKLAPLFPVTPSGDALPRNENLQS